MERQGKRVKRENLVAGRRKKDKDLRLYQTLFVKLRQKKEPRLDKEGYSAFFCIKWIQIAG